MPKPLRDLLPEILQQAAAQRKTAQDLQRHWQTLVGASVARHARAIALRKGLLYIQTHDAGAHFTLSMDKPRLLREFSKAVGQPVTDWVIRAGE